MFLVQKATQLFIFNSKFRRIAELKVKWSSVKKPFDIRVTFTLISIAVSLS